MNTREIEHLEKKSIYSLRVSDDLKESVIQSEILQLTKIIKKNIRNNNLIILILNADK